MNGIIEIILLIACCGVICAVAVCFIGEEVLTRRYKRFYELAQEHPRL